jgi:hypothetical protein
MVWQNIGVEEKSSFEEDIPMGMTIVMCIFRFMVKKMNLN